MTKEDLERAAPRLLAALRAIVEAWDKDRPLPVAAARSLLAELEGEHE